MSKIENEIIFLELPKYMNIFFRAYQFAGEDGCLSKKNFIKILRSSDLFMKSFDKNKDGVVTEVNFQN